MPLYDFQCTKCDLTFEIECKIAEKDDTHTCPECKCKKTNQVIISAPKLGDSIRLGLNPKQKEFREVLQKIHRKTPGSRLDKTANIL